jgi:DNA-binding LytR/AlgR family response regulator
MTGKNKTKVLIVENEPVIAMDIRLSLEQMGYEVAGTAASYKDALEISHSNAPDIALMDINIDGNKDGIQTARALRMHFDIPVIFLTSLTELDTIQKAKESEPFGYLVKPFRKDELQSSIEIGLFNWEKTRHLKNDIHRFSSAIRVLDTAIIILSPEGVIEYYNAQTESLTGWGKEEKVNTGINQFMVIEGKPAWLYLESFNEKDRLQRSFDFVENSYILDKENQKLEIEGHITSFHTAEGQIAGYVAVFSKSQGTMKQQPQLPIGGQIINDYVFLRDKSSLYRIHLEDITHIEALGNYVRVHTPQKIYTVLAPLKDIEQMLPSDKFFRVHRSFIVALKHISAIHNVELMVGNTTIPIGKTFKEDLLKRIQII